MEIRIDFLNWLSKKLALTNIATYLTIALSMVFPWALGTFGIPLFFANFFAFAVITLLRAIFESLIIYETPASKLSLHKILILDLITASVTSTLVFYLKPMLGSFVIPVAVIISRKLVSLIKDQLWQTTARPGFFAELPTKLNLNMLTTYRFFGILVGITYVFYGKYNFNFLIIFPIAYFLAMIVEEFFIITTVYDLKISPKSTISLTSWSAFCAIISTAIVLVLMKGFGLAGQPATIIGVIAVKLVQTFGSRIFVYQFSKKVL